MCFDDIVPLYIHTYVCVCVCEERTTNIKLSISPNVRDTLYCHKRDGRLIPTLRSLGATYNLVAFQNTGGGAGTNKKYPRRRKGP